MINETSTPDKRGDIKLVDSNDSSQKFASYAEDREKWLSTPIAHNQTLARSGVPFSIIAATEREMEATELDTPRGYKLGDPIDKIAYLCVSQQEWWHNDPQGEDTCYPEGEPFILLMNPNAIRRRDLQRVQEILEGGNPIYNVCAKEISNRTKGYSPTITLVSAEQWTPLQK